MSPNAPAAAPLTSNTNLPYGTTQASQDQQLGSNILSFLPSQEQQSATTSNNGTSMLPTVNTSYSTFGAPTAPTVNAGSFGSNLTGYNAAVQGAEQGLTSNENSEYNTAISQYEQNMNQFGNLTGVYNNLANTYNLPGYQQDIVGLQGLLQNLNQDVNSQTTLGGGLMTESARDESYANRAQPLNMALSNASQELGAGQTDVNNLLNAYETSLTNSMAPEVLNIQGLPTLFGQTNSAAEAGYGQGEDAIQSTISDQLQKEQVQAEQEQASAAELQAKALAGNGGNAASVLGGASSGATNPSAATYGLKVANNPSAGYYFENQNGQPINAIQYAQATGASPSAVVTAMAKSGDTGAQQLVNEVNLIVSSGGAANTDDAINKFYGNF